MLFTFNDPSQPAPYLTPPPVRRGRSPWFWVAMGCGLLLLLTFGGCIAAGLFVGNRVQEEMRRAETEPLTEKQIRDALGSVPLYPNSTANIEGSKRIRAVTRTVGGLAGGLTGGRMKMEMAVFDAPAPPDKVVQWYNEQLKDWKQSDAQGRGRQTEGIMHARQYVKGDQQVMVQAGPRQDDKGSVLILFVMSGVPQR